MEAVSIHLKVLLPFREFLDVDNVKGVVVETSGGFYGFLPRRLDCVVALVPGILTYETTNDETHYLAIDRGLLVKEGPAVTVSVRNAIEGADLGKLRQAVTEQFMKLNEMERNVRDVMIKLESGFIQRLKKLYKE